MNQYIQGWKTQYQNIKFPSFIETVVLLFKVIVVISLTLSVLVGVHWVTQSIMGYIL